MKINILSKVFFAHLILLAQVANAGHYVYSDLQMKTYDEMQESVNALVSEAQEISDDDMDGAKTKLQAALQLIFSRPNTDNMVSQLVPLARTPLRNVEAYESTVQKIATDAIVMAKNKKAASRDAATAIIILNNIMSELKPDIKSNKAVHAIFKSIRDARIKVDTKVKNELSMRAMIKVFETPSELAKKIIGRE